MIVVSDTSPFFYLAKLNLTWLLHRLYSTVILPATVADELHASRNEQIIAAINQPGISIRLATNQIMLADLLHSLDPGESEAIVLAIENEADFLMIDERRGNTRAVALGIHTIGVLGVFLAAKKAGLISSVKECVDQLTASTTFRHTPALIRHVLQLANE